MLGYPAEQYVVRGDETAWLASPIREYNERKMPDVETHREHDECIFDNIEQLGLWVEVQSKPNRQPEGEHWQRISHYIIMTEKMTSVRNAPMVIANIHFVLYLRMSHDCMIATVNTRAVGEIKYIL